MKTSRRALLATGLALIFALSAANRLPAETSAHERLGVERDAALELDAGLAFELYPSLLDEREALGLDARLSLELLAARSFGIAFELPATASLAMETAASRRCGAAQGDPRLAASYSTRRGANRYTAELSYRHPLGLFRDEEVAERGIATGTGYPTIGLALSLARFMDPLVLSLSFRTRTGLSREENYGSSCRPLDLGLDAGFTEALNDRAALSFGIAAGAAAPRLSKGAPDAPAWIYDLAATASLALYSGDTRLSIGASRSLTDPYSGGSLTVAIGRIFDLRRKPPE